MNKIIAPHGTGKTKELIKKASEINGVIVCKNVSKMLDKVHTYGYPDALVISYEEFLTKQYDHLPYFIDDVEGLLNTLSKKQGNIFAFTICSD